MLTMHAACTVLQQLLDKLAKEQLWKTSWLSKQQYPLLLLG